MERKLIKIKELVERSTDIVSGFNELRAMVFEENHLSNDPFEIYLKEQRVIEQVIDFFFDESDILNKMINHPDEEVSQTASLRANEISSMLRSINMHQTKYTSPITVKNYFSDYKNDFEYIYEKFIKRFESDITQFFENTDSEEFAATN